MTLVYGDFLVMTPKILFITEQIINLDLVKLKTSAIWKRLLRQPKPHIGRKIFAKHMSEEGLQFRIYKVYSKKSNKNISQRFDLPFHYRRLTDNKYIDV